MINTCISLFVAMSLHTGLEGDYSGIHPHVRCEINNTITGIYYNSEKTISGYAGYKFDMLFDSELEIGVVTGYSGMKIAPMIRFTKDNWYVAPSYEVTPNKNWGITIGYEFKIK